MNYLIVVEVMPRAGIADPEGATIERALPALGFRGVSHVRAGRSFRLEIEADSADAAIEKGAALAERLLSNPVIEDASVRLGEVAGS